MRHELPRSRTMTTKQATTMNSAGGIVEKSLDSIIVYKYELVSDRRPQIDRENYNLHLFNVLISFTLFNQ